MLYMLPLVGGHLSVDAKYLSQSLFYANAIFAISS